EQSFPPSLHADRVRPAGSERVAPDCDQISRRTGGKRPAAEAPRRAEQLLYHPAPGGALRGARARRPSIGARSRRHHAVNGTSQSVVPKPRLARVMESWLAPRVEIAHLPPPP